MKYPFRVVLLSTGILFMACKITKNNKPQQPSNLTYLESKERVLPTPPYRPAETSVADMQHLWLAIRFDYENETAHGKASLFVKPHFYPIRTLSLDAKYFLVHRLGRISGKDTIALTYTYDSLKLDIQLDKAFARTETIQLYVEYTAQPSHITSQGGRAISDDRGLYFINAQRKVKDKPRQIWTQGEPQANSGWVPLIDVPNQKLTQEIFMTVDESDVTLSNGELMYSSYPAKGKRTDYWKQAKPHAPYLIMMAVGEFSITKDFWRDSVEVNYYLEKSYAPHARLIFGKTPKMLECFSQKMGVDYPWEKYAQVVVRDFVSGAMENTGAVIHYDGVQHTPREHLDNTHEDIIAHELFHHWFGDLVTCESWSNISLNESFATYGEYLWNECEYDRNTADYFFTSNLKSYLRQRKKHDVQLMREKYYRIDDVFDVVSYQKGSRVLHMLRQYTGDEAFFASLKLYLTRHAYKTAEVHDLRQAFEEVTGEDLNWFFNQWYFNAGHPDLLVNHTLSADGKTATLTVSQMHDSAAYGLFRLPVDVAVVTDKEVTRKRIWIENRSHTFTFTSYAPILYVQLDEPGVLLANIEENKTHEQWYAQLVHTPYVLNAFDALNGLARTEANAAQSKMSDAISYALSHSFFGLRLMGLMNIDELTQEEASALSSRIAKLARNDSASVVRAVAINVLSQLVYDDKLALIENGLNDSSYMVVRSALRALSKVNREKALSAAPALLQQKQDNLTAEVLLLYSETPSPAYFDFFTRALETDNDMQLLYLRRFGEYLVVQSTEVQLRGAEWLKNYAEQKHSDNVMNLAKNAQVGLKKALMRKQEDMTSALKKTKDAEQKKNLEDELKQIERAIELL